LNLLTYADDTAIGYFQRQGFKEYKSHVAIRFG